MTSYPAHAAVPPPGCPAHQPTGLPPLYGPDFAADPESTYRLLHQQGPASWIELPQGIQAIVITDYSCALEVLRSPYFSKDARRWEALNQGLVPADSELLPMMAWRPSLLYADADRHRRLRQAADDCLARVDAHQLRHFVQASAVGLIQQVAPAGRADLAADYAVRLPVLVFTQLFGCPDEWVADMAAACSQMIDAEPAAAQAGGANLAALLGQLIAAKRERPGADLTSWLLEHPARLTDEEMVHQLVVLIGAGTVPMSAWISSTLMMMLTDDRFAGDLSGGSLTIGDALNDVLWSKSPMSNFCFHYATREYGLRDRHGRQFIVPPGVPVLVSLAAANARLSAEASSGHRAANHAHLAFSAGPHVCPAQDLAGVIAEVAVETLLDQLPDVQLGLDAADLTWRPGPFHRTLTALPARFPPSPAPTSSGSGAPTWNQQHSDSAPSWTPPAAPSTPRPPASARRARPSRWRSLVASLRGR
ncbi:cytochrome P450 [Streptomyces sp. NPDC059743]|uniref:cytochrome P450 n=1 Tax=Streptomyces sp. NPDC059743 TaxID=3346928 RepID=UPI00365CDF90